MKIILEESGRWRPGLPPVRGERDEALRRAFHVYMLTPGFSTAFHMATLEKSHTSIDAYRAQAAVAARADPSLVKAVKDSIPQITAEHGLRMAQLRGGAQLPYWSRIAICEFRSRGFSPSEIASAFQCSRGTVSNILQGKGRAFHPFSGERMLSSVQQAPAGQWRPAGEKWCVVVASV